MKYLKKQISIFILFFLSLLISLGFVSAVGTYPAVDPSMVLYYHFNNQSAYGENDTNVYDFSGNGNNGIVKNGALFKFGSGILSNGSYYFDGSNDYIYPKGVVNISRGSFALSIWYNNTRVYGTNDAILTGYNSIATGNRFKVFQDNANKTEVTIYNSSAVQLFTAVTTTLTYRNVWNHIFVNYDGANVSICNNGVCEKFANLTNIIDTDFYFLLGYPMGTLQWWNGNLDEFVVYNRSFSNKEIWNLYTDYLNEDCFSPNQNINYIGGNTTFCSGSYFINGSGNVFGEGSVVVKDNNIILNGNGVLLNGNGNGVGLSSDGYNGLILSNISLSGYNRSVFVRNGNNFYLSLFNITNFGTNALIFRSMVNSTFIDSRIVGNGLSVSQGGLSMDTSGNVNSFMNNYLENLGSGIYISLNTNSTISNNIINKTKYTTHCISTSSSAVGLGNTTGSVFYNNFLYDCGWNGIDISSSGNNISSNSIFRSYHNAIDLFDTSVVALLRQNTASANFNIIDSNVISDLNSSEDFPYAVGVLVVSGNNNNVTNNLISNCGLGLSIYSTNVTTHYTNNVSDNLIQNCSRGIYASVSNLFGLNVYNIQQYSTYYNYDLLNSKKFPISSLLTSALLTNGTSICNGSSSNLASNTGNINITLNPNEYCYVLDNFNITEGINREYSPIWFSSSSSTSKVISNNLTNAVTITTYINHSLPNRIYTYNESLIEYHSFGNDSFNNNSGLIEINLTIYPGNNTISFDCIEPFNNINILENLSTCVNKSYSITNLYISNNSIFTINANLTVDRIEKISGKLIKNTGRLIII